MTLGSCSIRRPFKHSDTLTGVAPLQPSQFSSGKPDRYRPTKSDGTITCIPRLGNVSLSMSTAWSHRKYASSMFVPANVRLGSSSIREPFGKIRPPSRFDPEKHPLPS